MLSEAPQVRQIPGEPRRRWLQTLADDGEFDSLKIAQLFKERSAEIDKRVADFVHRKLVQYRYFARR